MCGHSLCNWAHASLLTPRIWRWLSDFCTPCASLHTHSLSLSLTHTHTYTYIHTHTHIYIHTYIHTYTHTYTHTYIHTYCVLVGCNKNNINMHGTCKIKIKFKLIFKSHLHYFVCNCQCHAFFQHKSNIFINYSRSFILYYLYTIIQF
jgi:hypothetical protein